MYLITLVTKLAVFVVFCFFVFCPVHEHTFSRNWDVEPTDLNFQGLDFGIGHVGFHWNYVETNYGSVVNNTTITYEESLFVWLIRESGVASLP